MAKSNKEQKFPAEHILSLNSSADHSTLLQNEEEHGSELQQSVCLSVCLSQCNVTQIENLLPCRISCERFSGCKSREQSAKPSAARHVFRSADFKANRARRSPPHSVSTRLTPSLSHPFILSSLSTSPRLSHSTVDPRLAVLSTETVKTSPGFSH
jgi:hypothetical protein